jgi:hypothetical protein
VSSIWDPPDSPEEIARQALEAQRAEEAKQAAYVARMRSLYAKALGCSLIAPEEEGKQSAEGG